MRRTKGRMRRNQDIRGIVGDWFDDRRGRIATRNDQCRVVHRIGCRVAAARTVISRRAKVSEFG
jgi:hypothetical protein